MLMFCKNVSTKEHVQPDVTHVMQRLRRKGLTLKSAPTKHHPQVHYMMETQCIQLQNVENRLILRKGLPT